MFYKNSFVFCIKKNKNENQLITSSGFLFCFTCDATINHKRLPKNMSCNSRLSSTNATTLSKVVGCSSSLPYKQIPGNRELYLCWCVCACAKEVRIFLERSYTKLKLKLLLLFVWVLLGKFEVKTAKLRKEEHDRELGKRWRINLLESFSFTTQIPFLKAKLLSRKMQDKNLASNGTEIKQFVVAMAEWKRQ